MLRLSNKNVERQEIQKHKKDKISQKKINKYSVAN